MNKNCQLFYKRLRILFPSIGFAEGKFLRDIKMQLRDFSIENPGAEYEDVVEFFGNPEDVYINYMHNQNSGDFYPRFQRRKLVFYLVILFMTIIWLITFFYWRKSYILFNHFAPVSNEITIEGGVYSDEEIQ